jgi:hypothetical protein
MSSAMLGSNVHLQVTIDLHGVLMIRDRDVRWARGEGKGQQLFPTCTPILI